MTKSQVKRNSQAASDGKPQVQQLKVKAVFDSTKECSHGAHGIGCKN